MDARNSYYVLNPGADLEQTQNRLQNTIETLKWNGLVGKPPSIAEFKSALEQNDLFLYVLHGVPKYRRVKITKKRVSHNGVLGVLTHGRVVTC